MTTVTQNSPAVSSFQFQPHSVRCVMIDGNPWFVAADVCAALEIANSRDAVSRLDTDEKGVALTDTPGGKQQVTVISESGLYILILRCRDAMTPGSVPYKFRKWVTSEVLPAIRRTGSYTLPAPVVQRDYLTNADMLNLKRLIWTLTGSLRRQQSANKVIWANLRVATGVPAGARFEVCHLPAIENEMRRMFALMRPVMDAIDNAEASLLRLLVVGRHGHSSELARIMAEIDAATKGEQTLVDTAWMKFFNSDARALLKREPVLTGATYPDCNEPVDNFHTTYGSL